MSSPKATTRTFLPRRRSSVRSPAASLVARVRRAFVRFHRDEDGAAYTLSMVILLPFFVLLIATIVETTLLTTAQLGTQYAAYAAARTATVWMVADIPKEQRLGMIHKAAILALLPYASSSPDHAGLGSTTFQPLDAGETVLLEGYERFASAPRAPDYMLRKWQQAAKNCRVTVKRLSQDFNSPLEVTVEYDRPFFIAAVGMLFGRRTESGCYIRTLSYTVTLRAAGSKAADGKLGIRYDRQYGFTSSMAAPAAESLAARAANLDVGRVRPAAASPRVSSCRPYVYSRRCCPRP